MIADLAASRETAHRCVGGYRLERVLGRGRHSIVYLALEPRESRGIALKVAPRARPDALDATDLGREFMALRANAHRHTVQVYGHGVAGDQAFLAMEHAAGGPLSPKCGALSRASAISLIGQAAAALGWLHRHGWVHGDVKPANLLMRSDGSLALSDFGCARRIGERDAPRQRVVRGTPGYAAPEQTDGAAADPAADVYSLGACLYEILTGRRLYPGETLTEVFSQHVLAPVPRLDGEHAAWQAFLEGLLAKDPRRRPPDGQAVLWQLQREEGLPFLSQGSQKELL